MRIVRKLVTFNLGLGFRVNQVAHRLVVTQWISVTHPLNNEVLMKSWYFVDNTNAQTLWLFDKHLTRTCIFQCLTVQVLKCLPFFTT